MAKDAIDKMQLTRSVIEGKFSSKGLAAMEGKGLLDQLKAMSWSIAEPYTGGKNIVTAKLVYMLSYFGCHDALKWLFEHKHLTEADANGTLGGKFNLSVLFLAADNIQQGTVNGEGIAENNSQKVQTIKELLKMGADPWVAATDGETPFSACVRNGTNSHITALLPTMCQDQASLTKFNKLQFAIQVAGQDGIPQIQQLCLGAYLVHTKKLGLLQEFASYGINLDTIPVMKCDLGTILHTYADSNADMAKYYSIAAPIKTKEKTVDIFSKPIGARESYEITPLHVAAMNKQTTGPLLALLALGANADLATKDGLVALMFAAIALNAEAAIILADKTSAETLKGASGTVYATDPMSGSQLFPDENGTKHPCRDFLAAAKKQSENDVWDAILGIVDHKINPALDEVPHLGAGGVNPDPDSIYS